MLRWDPQSGEVISRYAKVNEAYVVAATSPDNRYVVSVSTDNVIGLWDMNRARKSGQPLRRTASSISRLVRTAQKLVTASDRSLSATIWDVETLDAVRTITVRSPVGSVAFRDNKTVITGEFEGVIGLWDVATGDSIARMFGHTLEVRSIDLSVDRRRLISGGNDESVRVWDLYHGAQLSTTTDSRGWV